MTYIVTLHLLAEQWLPMPDKPTSCDTHQQPDEMLVCLVEPPTPRRQYPAGSFLPQSILVFFRAWKSRRGNAALYVLQCSPRSLVEGYHPLALLGPIEYLPTSQFSSLSSWPGEVVMHAECW